MRTHVRKMSYGLILSITSFALQSGCSREKNTPINSQGPNQNPTLAMSQTEAGMNSEGAQNPQKSQDIIDVAESTGSFSTLLTAVRATGLEATIRSAPALTVFAPTDEAFAKLPEGALEALLANPEALKNVLLYHVVDGVVPSSIAVTLKEASMLNGGKTAIRFDGANLFVNDSRVIAADVAASNGVIHVIDSVLLPAQSDQESPKPEAQSDLISAARAAGQFSTLLKAVEIAGLTETLRDAKDVTLLAPTDAAFAKIPAETLNAILADKAVLTNILLYHVIGSRVPQEQIRTLSEATMLNGKDVCIKSDGEVLLVNDSRVLATDINGGNGIIHVIDAVLIP